MAFPTTLQDLDATRGTTGQTLASPNHITHHALEDSTIEALEAKVGVDGSAVTTSHDYKLGEVTGTDKAVGKTATQTLTNKTLTTPVLTSPTLNVGSDAEGDTYYRNSSGALVRLARGTDNYIYKMNGNVPNWEAETVTSNATTTTAGILELGTSAEVTAGTATGGSGAPLAVTPDALAASTPVFNGSALTNLITAVPEQEVPFVTSATTSYSSNALVTSSIDGNTGFLLTHNGGNTAYLYRFVRDTQSRQWVQTHSTTLAGTTFSKVTGAVTTSYLYVMAIDNGVDIIRRYDIADLANVTSITISGTNWNTGTFSFSDGTDLYVFDTNDTLFKYTISGTTATYSTSITYTSAGAMRAGTCDGANVWFHTSTASGSFTIKKYPLAGGSSTANVVRILFFSTYTNASVPSLFMHKSGVLGLGWGISLESNAAVLGAALKTIAITAP